MIALSFALPEESKRIVRRVAGPRRGGTAALPVISGTLAGKEVVILHLGMGMASATAQAAAFLGAHSPSAWIAAGFGGGLSEELEVGDIVLASNFSDAALLAAMFPSLPARTGRLITTKGVLETAQEKRDLARHTGAIAVDMETAAIHRLCTARGVPMLSLRAVSDTVSQDLPVPSKVWFDMATQRPRPAPLLLHLATHPGRIGPFAHFVGGINRARASLTTYLLRAVEALPEG